LRAPLSPQVRLLMTSAADVSGVSPIATHLSLHPDHHACPL
jgi:hypothetical protein